MYSKPLQTFFPFSVTQILTVSHHNPSYSHEDLVGPGGAVVGLCSDAGVYEGLKEN